METAKARTVAFATLILAQLVYVYDCRSEEAPFSRRRRRNLLLDGAVLSSCILMAVVIHHPLLSVIFGTVPLSVGEWAVALAAAFLPALTDLVFSLVKGGFLGKKRSLLSKYS